MHSNAQNSPFSSMMNFNFFDGTKKIIETEDSIKQEKYKIWKDNTSLLYENIMTHILEWPSLSVQWMYETNLSDGEDNEMSDNETQDNTQDISEISKYSLLLGTHTSGTDQDYIIIMDVSLPNIPISEDRRRFESRSDYAGFKISDGSRDLNAFQQRILIPHDGEVNRVIHSPSNINIIASKTISGNVHIYDLKSLIEENSSKNPIISEKTPTLILSGHELEGWALNWSPINESYLASGSDDAIICLWDLNKTHMKSGKTSSLVPLLKFKGHQKSVQDVSWHPSNENIIISVGDDGLIMMWDIRESAFPCCYTTYTIDDTSINVNLNQNNRMKKIIGYTYLEHGNTSINSLNTVEFNPFQTNLIAVGGSDPTIALFDIRNLKRRLHSLNGHSGQINRVKFLLEDVSLIASASSDCTISIWDLSKIGMEQRPDEVEDGVPELIFTHSGHTAPVNDFSCIISNLSTTSFASISENNHLHIWNPSETIFLSDDEDEELKRFKEVQVE